AGGGRAGAARSWRKRKRVEPRSAGRVASTWARVTVPARKAATKAGSSERVGGDIAPNPTQNGATRPRAVQKAEGLPAALSFAGTMVWSKRIAIVHLRWLGRVRIPNRCHGRAR